MRKFALLLLDLLIALYVTGCGAASDANQPVPGTATAVAVSTPSPTTAVAVPVADPVTNQKQLISFAVDDQKSLPTCDGSSEAEIAYVTAEKTLYACSGGEWAKIDLTGPQGPQGEKGDEGQVVQASPVPSPTPVVLGANEFIDINTGIIWTKSVVQVLFDDAKKVCTSIGRRLPTESELSAAVVLGTIKSLPVAGIFVWADTGREANPSAPGVMIDVEPTDKGFAYCVKDNI